MVALGLQHGAVQACVNGGAGGSRRARERGPCAARSGQPTDIDWARSRGGARGFSPVFAAGKRFPVSRQTWRRDDRDGGGQLRAGQTAVPMVAMSTAGWAWSDRVVPLLDGVGVWTSARWRQTTGGQWMLQVEE
jgi:hypothetical protein